MLPVVHRCSTVIILDFSNMLEAIYGALETNEIILTEEREAHIAERHGEKDVEALRCYGNVCIADPDYIIEDPSKAATVCFIREISQNHYLRLVVRLSLARDGTGRKNSIITAHTLSEKKLDKMLRNKKCIYKRE